MDLNYNSRGNSFASIMMSGRFLPSVSVRNTQKPPKRRRLKQFLTLMSLFVFLLFGNFGEVSAQINFYGFSTSTDGVLNPMAESEQLIGASNDDGSSSVVNIGFTFNYGGVNYTQFSVNANGIMRLGSSAIGSGTVNYTNSAANAGSNSPAIMPYWDDLATGVGGKVHYVLTGTAPNQKLIVEWFVTVPRSTSATAAAKFQCILEQGTNKISFVYGAGMISNTANSGASIGLATSATIYNTVDVTSHTHSTATFTTTNTAAIAEGRTYTFTPPMACEGTPEAGVAMPLVTNVCAGVVPVARTVTGSTSGVTGLTYQWEESINGESFVNAVGGTGATTLSYTPPAFAGTDIQYRLKVTCTDSGLFDYSEVSEVKGPIIPQTLPANLLKIENLAGEVNLSWTNGNGTRRYVVVNTVNEFTNPSTADVTGVSAAYTSGERIVYDGTGSSVVVTGLTPGTYFVKIYEYVRCSGTPNVNYYNIDFTPISLVVEGANNGSCANAIQLDLSNPLVTTKIGSTLGSVVGTDYLNCAALGSQATERGAWYKFTGNNKQVTFLTCHPTIGFDTRLSVYSGSCGSFSCVAVNDDVTPACVGASQYSSKVTFNALAGVEYYVFVHGYQTGTTLSVTGNFVLTWEQEDMCSPVTVNDECSSAQLLTMGTSTVSSNGCATQSFGVAFPSAGSALGTYLDTWYKFNSGNAVAARISLTYETPVEVGFSVYQNACGALTQITNASNLLGAQMNITGMAPNTDYYIRVYASQTVKRGDYTINLFEICALPTAITPLVESQNEATVSWTNSVSTTLGSYNYELRTSGAAGSGATGLVVDGTVNANSISFDSLLANTTYSFYIKSVCMSATDTSAWSTATTFFTGYCVPSSTLSTTFINNFSTVGAISNISNMASGYTATGYQNNYSSDDGGMSMSHHAGGSFSFTANITGGAAGLNVWVDWNNNFIFEDSEKLYGTTSTTSSAITQTVSVPADVALGAYRMRVLTAFGVANPSSCSTATTRMEAEDYKLTIVEQPQDAISWANLQAFVVGGDAVSTMQPCQTVDVYTQAWDAVATEPAGANPDLKVWIGRHNENTDPATWPESAFTLATYNMQVDNNDEYKVTYATLPAGNHYFVARYKLGFGPYKYGASNNGFWNEDANPAALLAVSIEAINVAASQSSFCETAEEVTLQASSSNSNFTYVWSNGLGNAASAVVTPTQTTTYTVTGTDSVTGCVTTASITIYINPLPTNATINFTDATMCVGSVQELSVNGGTIGGAITSGVGTFTSLAGSVTSEPNPLQNYYGGNKQQWIYRAQELLDLGFSANTKIKTISIDLTASNTTALQNLVVKMKNSSTESFASTTSWEANMETVRDAASHTPSVGQNVLTLNTPFTWDGTSNLVVELNYSNSNSGSGSSNRVKYSATTFPSTLMHRADGVTATQINNFTGTYPGSITQDTQVISTRTDIIFNVDKPAEVTWSPATDLYTDAAATVPYVADTPASVVYTKPEAAISYTATVTSLAGCSVTTPAQMLDLYPESPLPTVPGGSAGGGVENLIISEYGEGAGGNKKYIELFNGTGADVDLANYRLIRSTNGGGWTGAPLALSGPLANNSTFTIANNNTDVIGADIHNSSFIQFNGDDAIGLEWNGGSGTVFTLIDVFGQHDNDPGAGWTVAGIANATVDRILTRKSSVCVGNVNWTVSSGTDEATSEWIVSSFTYNDVAQTAATLGSHTANCGASQPGALELCPTATVADILSEVIGTDVKLYDTATGGVALSETADLVEGSYYASQVVGGCESSRAEIVISFSDIQTPDFAPIGTICEGSVAPILATTSPNGVEGTWSPAVIDNMANGTYVFTPNAGICAATQTLMVTVSATQIVPDFDATMSFCSTDTMPELELTSPNGIIGTWSPSVIDNTTSGTYTFTPNEGQCGSVRVLTVTIGTAVEPNFENIAICSGDTVPTLALTSPNGITGTWAPSAIDGTLGGDYMFTPDEGQCAVAQTISVTINELPSLVINNPEAVCAGGTVDITAAAITAGSDAGLTFSQWADPFGNVSFPAPNAITSSGTFYIKAENASGCSVILPVVVIVKAAVDAPTTANSTQDFTTGDDLTDFEVTGTDLIWYDAPTAGDVLPSSTVITTGTAYYVSQTVDGCESATRLMITAGVDLRTPGFDTASLKYYPNPVSDILTVTNSNTIESIEIFNVLGQKVYQKAHNAQEVKIDMSSLATGNYIVNVMTNGLVKNIKVIKK